MGSKKDALEAFERFEWLLPDVAGLSDRDLKHEIADLADVEEAISCRRSLLQEQLEILRAERVARLRESPTHVDVGQVADALLRKALRSPGPLTARVEQLRALLARQGQRRHGYAASLADALAVLEDRGPSYAE